MQSTQPQPTHERVTLRIPSYMLQRIRNLSQNQERTTSATIRFALKEYLERRQ